MPMPIPKKLRILPHTVHAAGVFRQPGVSVTVLPSQSEGGGRTSVNTAPESQSLILIS